MEKELPRAYLHRREQTHFFKIARRLSIIEDNTGILQSRKHRMEQLSERRMEKWKQERKEERKKVNMVFEQILDFHLATINNDAEWPVEQRKEKKKKKKKYMELEQILGAFDNQEEEQSEGVDDWLQTLLTMTEETEEKYDGQRKRKRNKEKKAMKRILQVHANKVSQGILDPDVKTFHEMAVMTDRQRNNPHQALPTMVGAKEKDNRKGNGRSDKVLEQVLEIHMNTTKIKAEWPVDAEEKENDEVPTTIQSAPSKHHRYQL
jgi:hypothetical protein